MAEQKFLELLKSFSEVWICAFGFTLQPMFDELKKADAAGAKLHVLLDHSQAIGKAELPKLKDLVSNLKHSDLTNTLFNLIHPQEEKGGIDYAIN